MASQDLSSIPPETMAKFCDEMEEVKEMMTHNMEVVKERGEQLAELQKHTKHMQKGAAEINVATGGTPAASHDGHHSAAAEHVKQLIQEVEKVEEIMEKNLERIHERGERLDQLDKTL